MGLGSDLQSDTREFDSPHLHQVWTESAKGERREDASWIVDSISTLGHQCTRSLMDQATLYESVLYRFESCRVRHFKVNFDLFTQQTLRYSPGAMPGPIKPNEAETEFPEGVYEAFNELIRKNLRGKTATVKQRDVAQLIASKLELTLTEVLANGYLDVEDAYRKAGWKVEYDKPGYNESYEPHFAFTKK